MARCFVKVLEEEIEEEFFYPSDSVNTKTTIPLRVSEIIVVDIYLDASHLSIYEPLFTSSSWVSCIIFELWVETDFRCMIFAEFKV